jgi:tetratricopeptide (TPR) repeat protein
LPKPGARQWLPLLAALAACVLVCGWHYWRVWRHFGQPLFPETRWAYGKAWWQDPGYQTAAYFGRFGCALARPFFSGLYSFWDGMYSTLWGDGLCGGAGILASRPPWNYELMALGCLLALLPTVLIAMGLVSAVRGILRHFDCAWLILLGFGFAMALAILHLNLVVPSYAEAKAIFGLSAILAVCACAARGWYGVDRLPKLMRRGVMIGLAVWALVAYASFWIRGGSAATQAVLGRGLMRQGNYDGAIAHLELALRQDPLCPQARTWLVAILLDQGRASNAAPIAAEAVLKGPPRASYQMDLSKVLEAQARLEDALDHARRAVELAPDDPDARLRCATLAFRLGHFADAIGFCREALRLSPTDPELHFVLGYSLVNAARQPGVPLALGGGESLLPETAHDLSVNELLTVQALIHFRYVIRLSPDSPDALNNLAWLLATHPRPELRNGIEAVGLAQRACELTDYSKPDMLGTLAAAYAETGQFPLALEIAQKAEKLSQSSGDRSMQDRHKQFIGLFHDHQPVRMELPGGGHG